MFALKRKNFFKEPTVVVFSGGSESKSTNYLRFVVTAATLETADVTFALNSVVGGVSTSILSTTAGSDELAVGDIIDLAIPDLVSSEQYYEPSVTTVGGTNFVEYVTMICKVL
jgi:hypothetical protein